MTLSTTTFNPLSSRHKDKMEDEALDEVPCSLRSPVYLHVPILSEGEPSNSEKLGFHLALSMEEATGRKTQLKKPRGSGCQVVDVTLRSHSSSPLRYLVFKNRYTYSITVKYLKRATSMTSPPQWVMCIRNHTLMPNCHCEQGSQNWNVLTVSNKETSKDITRLRLILRQPSPQWKEFGVDHVTCYTASSTDSTPPQQQPYTPSNGNTVVHLADRLGDLLSLVKEAQDCVSDDNI